MEKNEFIASDGTTIVFGGGANLPNAPESWEQFYKWVDEANKDKDEYGEPYWGTDCHFKLDYDGPLVTVSSRFYPPAKYYGPTWDRSVTVYVGEKEIVRKKFDCPTMDELRTKVETYVKVVTVDVENELIEALKKYVE